MTGKMSNCRDRTEMINDSESLTLAVLSDLHAFDKTHYSEVKPPSFLDMSVGEDRHSIHPISALKKLITSENLRADIIICAGDLGDKANPTYIQYTWTKLHELKKLLHSRLIAATPGNHDHDSRSKYCKFDPRGALQNLSPKFPLEKENDFNCFWAKNYTIVSDKIFRIVILNSSAFQGIGDEIHHGRISPWTLEGLEKDIDVNREFPINILVCHHHPQKHEGLNLTDYEVMDGGQSLLRLLGTGRFGQWIIIHGHKHYPMLSYAQGSTGGPVVFSAGSLCAYLDPEIQSRAQNQFYLIKFSLKDMNNYGFVGRFKAWDWYNGYGWKPAADKSGLPSAGGFGYRKQLELIAKDIAKLLNGQAKKEWYEIAKAIPQLAYLIPSDLENLENQLSKRHALSMERSSEGLILQIGKKGT